MKKIFTGILLLVLFTTGARAQLIYQPYSYQFYQKLNKDVYSPATSLHTSLKPYLFSDSSALRPLYDSLMMLSGDTAGKSWIHKLLFNNHLVDIKNKDYTFYLDYLPDLQIGRQFSPKQSTDLNTRGYQLAGTIGANFFFYTSGYENQGKFPDYINAYINKTGMVPGEAFNKTTSNRSSDWSYVTSLIGFTPNKAVTIVIGEDKTFIGDGYRSVLLSDFASNYPLLRLTVNLGKNVQYMAMWAYMEDQNAVQFNSFTNNRRKWGAFHYIDWNINNRASLGFFNALITEEANDQGKLHGFDVNYVNPILFASSLGPSSQAPDHTLVGLNGKYKILDKTTVYGQFLYDQGTSTINNNGKDAWQLGFRGSDLFKVNSLNYLFEFNTASPYTYSSQSPIVNYAELNEPLSDPFGANFKEVLGIINYSIGKFDLQGQVDYAKYGLSPAGTNFGNDLTLPNNVNVPAVNSGTGQGLSTSLKYAEGTVSYLLNPKYNLRIEIGGILREEKNSQTDTKTALITFGLRSSFRDLYHDF
jgi:hypothetical protein